MTMINRIKYCLMVTLFYIFRVFPIRRNKIVISNFAGKGFGDNGKYIAQELLKRGNQYDIVWLSSAHDSSMPAGIRSVPFVSARSVFEQATAGVWIDNRRKPGYVRKRKGQYYVQTWHGIKGLKKTEKNAESVLPKSYIKAAKNDSKMADLFVASCELDYKEYQKSWWYTGEIAKCGMPRLSVLYRNEQQFADRIRSRLSLPEGKKTVLYVPTFRRNLKGTDTDLYQLDWERLCAALSKKFGGEWVGLLRLHPAMSSRKEFIHLSDHVIDVSSYDDVEELLYIADIAITDYSSTILDYGIQGRPGFLFAKDLENYQKNDQGNYFPLSQFPFPLSQNEDELISNIDNFDSETYKQAWSHFYHDTLGIYDCRNGSSQIADRIENVVNS